MSVRSFVCWPGHVDLGESRRRPASIAKNCSSRIPFYAAVVAEEEEINRLLYSFTVGDLLTFIGRPGMNGATTLSLWDGDRIHGGHGHFGSLGLSVQSQRSKSVVALAIEMPFESDKRSLYSSLSQKVPSSIINGVSIV